MPTPRTHARSVSTCHVFCLIHDDRTDRQTDKQLKRVVSYYRTTYRRGDKSGRVLLTVLRTVEEIIDNDIIFC